MNSYKVVGALLLFSLSACQTQTVEPWEREWLSRKSMTQPVSNLSNQLKQHAYFSKEGSSGGSRASAGGCGCN